MARQPYCRPVSEARVEFKEKGSRFIGVVVPVKSEAEALERVEDLRRKYHDSSHVCWAARLEDGQWQRAADDGEPRGTAGLPILNVLEGNELGDVLLAVVRYFGGTKLGKGGLVRAYSEAARLAVEQLSADAKGMERVVPREYWRVEVDYSAWGAVENLLARLEADRVQVTFGERVEAVVAVPVGSREDLEKGLASWRLQASQVEP